VLHKHSQLHHLLLLLLLLLLLVYQHYCSCWTGQTQAADQGL
jgi:hypothetical protein